MNIIAWIKIKLSSWLFKSESASPQPASPPEYVPMYGRRSELEHEAIRAAIQHDSKTCSHMKGGRYVRSPRVDYNVRQHTYPNLATDIKCLSCRTTWKEGDEGWEEAVRMMRNSTNTPTRSEVVLRSAPPFYIKGTSVEK